MRARAIAFGTLVAASVLAYPPAAMAEGGCAGKPIMISVLRNGSVIWGGELVDDAALRQKFAEATATNPMPNARLVADKRTRYGDVVRVVAIAQKAGFHCFGFVGIETSR